MNSEEAKSSPNPPAEKKQQQQQQNKNRRKQPPHWKKKRGNNNNNNNQRKPNNNNNNNSGGTKNNNNSYRNRSSNNKKERFIDVYTNSDFQAMHERCVQMGLNLPIKYKIHKPQSPALQHKLEQGTLRYMDQDQQQPQPQPQLQPSNIDGMIVRPDTKTLQFFFLGNTNTTSLSEFSKNPRGAERKLQQQMDASFETTTSTNVVGAASSTSVMEQVTRDMAALSTTTTTTNAATATIIIPTKDSSMIKFACAADLLAEEPNGFACVASSSPDVVEKVRDWTRTQALQVANKATDHGDFVVSLPQELLWEFLQASKKMKKKATNKPPPESSSKKIRPLNQIQDEILSRMAQQGVQAKTFSNSQDQGDDNSSTTKLKFGHHLESLMYLMMESPSRNKTNGNKKNNKNKNRRKEEDTLSSSNHNNDTPADSPTTTTSEDYYYYMLIYGFDDSTAETQTLLELNIPGGKRALGETSVQAAIRETKEETSLQWDETWITKIYHNEKDPSLKMNRYYMLHPPANFLETFGGVTDE